MELWSCSGELCGALGSFGELYGALGLLCSKDLACRSPMSLSNAIEKDVFGAVI